MSLLEGQWCERSICNAACRACRVWSIMIGRDRACCTMFELC